MSSNAQRIVGRYIERSGLGDLTVSITKVGGKDAFEILIKRKYEDSKGPAVIQRVVVDVSGPNIYHAQGQNVGRHGELGMIETFTELRIKDMVYKVDQNKHKIYVQEFR